MEIKLNKDFLDLDGKVMNNSKECCIQKSDGSLALSEGEYVIIIVPTPEDKLELKQVCIQALLTDFPDDAPGLKGKKYELFQKFHNANRVIELKSEDTTLIKNQIEKVYPTLVMGQAHAMLEGK